MSLRHLNIDGKDINIEKTITNEFDNCFDNFKFFITNLICLTFAKRVDKYRVSFVGKSFVAKLLNVMQHKQNIH